jgi:hypothetical protein
MYINLKKATSMIILASIVATTNISMFAGYATGTSSDAQTELGESKLVTGFSTLDSNASNNTENELAKLKMKVDMEGKKSDQLGKQYENLEQKLFGILLTLEKLEKTLSASHNHLVESRIEFQSNKSIGKKLKIKQQVLDQKIKKFNSECEIFESQLQSASDALNKVKAKFYEYSQLQQAAYKEKMKLMEEEAKYYKLNELQSYNELYQKYCNALEEHTSASIDFITKKRDSDKYYIEYQQAFLKLLKQSQSDIKWTKENLPKSVDSTLNAFESLAKVYSNESWVQTLKEYTTLMYAFAKIEKQEKKVASAQQGKSIYVLEKVEKEIEEIHSLAKEKYNLEHCKLKLEVGVSKLNNLSEISNTLSKVNDFNESDPSDTTSEPDLSNRKISEEESQVKIDKSSDYNKEKKLRLKGEKRKNKKNSKRGTAKSKDINYQGENSQKNAGMFIKAKIIRKEEPAIKDRKFGARDNDLDEADVTMQSNSSNDEESIEDISDDSIESEDTMESNNYTDDSREMLEHDFIKQYIPNAQFFRFD